MAGKAKIKPDYAGDAHVEAHRAEAEPLDIQDSGGSPARKLQYFLESQWDERANSEYVDDRWSIRATIAFVFLSCSLLWAGIIYIGQALF